VDRYKAVEVHVVTRSRQLAGKFLHSTLGLWHGVQRVGSQKLTIMFVPHSQRRAYHLSMSMFALAFVGVLLATLLVVSLSLSAGYTSTREQYRDASRALAVSETTFASMTDEVKELQHLFCCLDSVCSAILNRTN